MAITQNNSGSEAVGIINQALGDAGSSVVIGNESGSSVSGKLNEVFGDDVLDDSQSGSEWAQAVDEGLENMDIEPLDAVVKFLHISDPHGSSTATTKAIDLLADEDFVFVTGDVTAYNNHSGISSGLQSDFTAIGNKLIMLAGNHDTYDNNFGQSCASQQVTTNWLKSWLGERVTWGDTSGKGSYWHKDIQLSATSKLRIISLDQYEIDKVRNPGQYTYYTMYSQAQVNWLIALLKDNELTANDYLIIATHEPPVQSPYETDESTNPDQYAERLRPSSPYFTGGTLNEPDKLFVTEGLRAFGNRYYEPNLNLLPRILYAYMHKQPLSLTYNNYEGGATPDITINENFSSVNPATFLFWIGGHRHADICTYLPDESQETDGGDWRDQLMLYITAGDTSIDWQLDDDLGGKKTDVTPTPTNTDTYRLNEVTLDFGEQTITVKRYGAKNTAGGRVRDEITFPFKKGGTT